MSSPEIFLHDFLSFPEIFLRDFPPSPEIFSCQSHLKPVRRVYCESLCSFTHCEGVQSNRCRKRRFM